MPELSQAKILGGIGSIFLFISVFMPIIGAIIWLIGVILWLIAIKYIADCVNEPMIFRNAVYTLLSILASFSAFLIILMLSGAFFMHFFYQPELFGLWSVFCIALPSVIAAWLFLILSAVFLKRSFDKISERLKTKNFSVAALLYLVGVVLLIVIIGFLLLLIAMIWMIIAFLSLPDKLPES